MAPVVSDAKEARPGRPGGAAGPLRAFGLAVSLVLLALLFASGVVRCPSAQFLSVSCPACGSTRSMHALLRGDLHGVLFYAPLAPVTVAGLLWIGLRAIMLTYKGMPWSGLERQPGVALALRGLVFIVFVQVFLWGLRAMGLCGGPVPLP